MAPQQRPKYRRPGGVIGVPREMIRSPAFKRLSLPARCLILELQDVWNPGEPAVHYSLRRAVDALGVSMGTASKAFKELLAGGFLRVAKNSDLYERKAREYILTWVPTGDREPSDEWRINGHKNNSAFSQSSREAPICFRTVAEKPKRAPAATKNQSLTRDKRPTSATQAEHH